MKVLIQARPQLTTLGLSDIFFSEMFTTCVRLAFQRGSVGFASGTEEKASDVVVHAEKVACVMWWRSQHSVCYIIF